MRRGFAPILQRMVAPPLPLVDVDYCDDTVVPVVATAGELVQKCADVVYVANAVFLAFGFSLNFAHNKTNVLPYFAGPGAVGARQSLFSAGQAVNVEFYGGSIVLRFVSVYKHMGTSFSMSHDLRNEVVSRAAMIRSVGSDIKKVI